MFFSSLKNLFSKSPYPQKKVLVLEGGGMRGIFLTGVMQAFTDRNYFPWKLIIGSSAGALTGASYAAQQIHISRDAFFTKLLTGDFIHFSNIIRKGKHILDLDWMVDTILAGDEPIDLKKLYKSAKVYITATDCKPHVMPKTIYFDSKKDDLLKTLKASAAIPFLYRGFVQYKDYALLDGGLLDPIPYKKPLELGYKEEDILVVVTRPRGYRKSSESFWIKTLLENYYKEEKHKLLVRTLENRYQLYNKIVDDLEQVYTNIDIIYPPDNFNVDRLTQDEAKLLEGFEMGILAAKEFLWSNTRPNE